MIDGRSDQSVVYMDVWNASQYEGKLKDNVHMEHAWYKSLAGFLKDVLVDKCLA